MIKKLFKFLVSMIALGTAAAGIIYLFKSKSDEELDSIFSEDVDEDDFDDDDFVLDQDLAPAGEREYVSLTPAAEKSETEAEIPQL